MRKPVQNVGSRTDGQSAPENKIATPSETTNSLERDAPMSTSGEKRVAVSQRETRTPMRCRLYPGQASSILAVPILNRAHPRALPRPPDEWTNPDAGRDVTSGLTKREEHKTRRRHEPRGGVALINDNHVLLKLGHGEKRRYALG